MERTIAFSMGNLLRWLTTEGKGKSDKMEPDV